MTARLRERTTPTRPNRFEVQLLRMTDLPAQVRNMRPSLINLDDLNPGQRRRYQDEEVPTVIYDGDELHIFAPTGLLNELNEEISYIILE